LYIDCILAELIAKKTRSIFGAKSVHKEANTPGTDQPFQGLLMILSKLFLPEGRMWRAKRNEDKKAGKKKEKEQEEIWNGFSKKKVQILA